VNILEKIIEHKIQEVELQKANYCVDAYNLRKKCDELPETKSFKKVLAEKTIKDKIALIAEVKKASPSKGVIRDNFNPLEIALAYQNAGASAVSVLTDEKFFQGSIEYLINIAKAVNIPILRKDFIIDPFQVYQTRLIGADIILLIISALSIRQFKELYAISKDIGLDVIVEVHNEQEYDIAERAGAEIIGINNRNLKNFKVSIDQTLNLIRNKNISNKFIVSESGINSYSDINILKQNGISAVLVGEYFMKKDDIQYAVYELMKDLI